MDINLSGNMNGVEATRFLRTKRHTATLPVLMLTAKSENLDVVKGLNEGADDYLGKPFDMEIFMARLKSCQRRAERNHSPVLLAKQKLNVSGIEIDPISHQVVVAGRDIGLTMTEFMILSTLMSKPNEVLTRDDLLFRVMGPSKAVTARTIDVHIRALRAKLSRKARHVGTVRGVGYKFVP